MANFKLGDKVRLKSGGPVMTVSMLPARDATVYGCMWFAVAHYAEVKTGKAKETIPVFCPDPQYRSFEGDSLEILK